MDIITQVDMVTIIEHLNRTGSRLWNRLDHVFGRPADYSAYKVRLDALDYLRFVLWWEYENHSIDKVGRRHRLIDMVEHSVLAKPEVKSLIWGDPQKNLPPIDLRNTRDLEPVMVTDSLDSPILYLIDGNNRVIAQHFTAKGFRNVSAYVCVNPNLMDLGNIPPRYREEGKRFANARSFAGT